ncbi:hypothetical protein [Leptolyngbya sp. PCC 6406]|uniref:hypothetical protein n=1 Tax=Leptolyngbya sp. PCC 6406 TaxID=1173264 RepID=UPI0002ABD13D|nr:hypothetical protein [Leptolyngbya sp. PCC 6406]
MYFVSVTRLRLRSPWHLPAFMMHNLLTTRQAQRTPGFIAGGVAADAHHTYWTLTLWTEAAAMKLLRDQGAHRRVMPQIQNWCDEAITAHWQQDSPLLPTLEEAYQQIQAGGHWTRLKNPSPAQEQRVMPPPPTARIFPLRPHHSPAAAQAKMGANL